MDILLSVCALVACLVFRKPGHRLHLRQEPRPNGVATADARGIAAFLGGFLKLDDRIEAKSFSLRVQPSHSTPLHVWLRTSPAQLCQADASKGSLQTRRPATGQEQPVYTNVLPGCCHAMHPQTSCLNT